MIPKNIKASSPSLEEEDQDESVRGGKNDASTTIGTGNETAGYEEARDEVKEIQNLSRMETQLIRTWRVVLLLLLVVTAAAVSSVTFILLKKEEDAAYRASFEKFAQSLGDASQNHDKTIKQSLGGLADAITAYSESVNANWPFFHMPYFASYALNAMKQSGAEMVWMFNTVPHELREEYVAFENEQHYLRVAEAHMLTYGDLTRMPENSTYVPDITWKTSEGFVPDIDRDFYYATSETVPPPYSYLVWNWNANSVQFYDDILRSCVHLRNESLWTNVRAYTTAGVSFTPEQHEVMHSNRRGSQPDQPHSFIWKAVFRSLQDDTSDAVAILNFPVAWDVPLRNALPESVQGINVVLRNTCNQSFTYLLNGPDAFYMGEGDLHDKSFDDVALTYDLWDASHPEYLTVGNHCLFSITVYPTEVFKASHESNTPQIYAAIIAATFLLMIAAFVAYDIIVQRRNQKLVVNAARSNAIVTSLFPKNVRDRLVAQDDHDNKENGKKTLGSGVGGLVASSAPIADLHLESTILFADVVGFTAWSSVREPAQVFTLLETLYGAFDKIAEARRVFKVETVGDCYVAATGIPTYRKDHASAMVRFAADIMAKMNVLVKRLEVLLGPDTGDLRLRIGIHSGPITAGVLRGQRSRFQLFGDTMNTTARIESSSQSGKIHMSSETAEYLARDGKEHWIEKRKDLITAKGKGSLQTYWLRSVRGKYCFSGSEDTGSTSDDTGDMDSLHLTDRVPGGNFEKLNRLIEWNTETLLTLLKQIVARRSASRATIRDHEAVRIFKIEKKQSNHPLKEVQEIISLPEYNADTVSEQKDPASIELPEAVVAQVREYVSAIAAMYRKNGFHNFEHASHVTMSVTKLLSRIVAPKDIEGDDHNELHDHTYGITSDPLTQFACAFSALIHDVDHTGVPNAQLVKEKHPITEFYNNRSVAEQFSLSLSWDLLMEDRFQDLRQCLYTTEAELMRFRHLVVNGVMATDIADKDLKNLRNARWGKAFDNKTKNDRMLQQETKADVDRKATIVIEHLIQASDIAHTMQHWHVYRKWNERLFTEMYQAYLDGRADKDPSTFWYKGEIGFFDFYILPLAKKLKECGVFGVSSDEYLNYALKNREEWERCGQDVVADMMSRIPQSLSARKDQAKEQ